VLYLSLGSSVIVDILLACSLTILLRRCHTGFSRTDSVIQILVIYSVNSGVLTSLCATICFVCFVTMQSNFIFLAVYFVLPKLLLNSLLATLNAGYMLRKAGNTNVGLVTIPLSTPASAHDRVHHIKHDGSDVAYKNHVSPHVLNHLPTYNLICLGF
ncbi:hypothetical protein CERSUDRAFT_58868, partial [Gelatoporia subvermispora B]